MAVDKQKEGIEIKYEEDISAVSKNMHLTSLVVNNEYIEAEDIDAPSKGKQQEKPPDSYIDPHFSIPTQTTGAEYSSPN